MTMAEYIKREAVFEQFDNGEADVIEMYPDGSCDFGFGASNIRDMINAIPAADVAPVRHGQWILDEYARYFRCSACGTQFDDETDTYCNIMNGFAPNYCEECGAKMDGDTDGT